MKLTPIKFAELMQKELDSNVHKGNFEEWSPTREESVRELDHHVEKLKEAIKRWEYCELSIKEVKEYAADVANICMKIVELGGIN